MSVASCCGTTAYCGTSRPGVDSADRRAGAVTAHLCNPSAANPSGVINYGSGAGGTWQPGQPVLPVPDEINPLRYNEAAALPTAIRADNNLTINGVVEPNTYQRSKQFLANAG